MLSLDPAEGGPLDCNPAPHLVTRRWVYDQYQSWWHGDDNSSPNWLSRVLARFPDQVQNALIKLAWLEAARQRPVEDAGAGSAPLTAGVDVGAGEAETVVYVCECAHNRRRIVGMGAWRSADARGQVVNFLNEFRLRLYRVRVDSIGFGYHFATHLRDLRFPVEMVNVSMPCPSKPLFPADDPARRFVNRRAEYYQALADAIERELVEGLTDETTIGQLAGVLYEIDSVGRMKIESKESARRRGVRSPDRADALMLALGDPSTGFDIRLTSNRPSRDGAAARRGAFPTGFVELEYDDEDDRPPSLRRQLDALCGKFARERFGGF